MKTEKITPRTLSKMKLEGKKICAVVTYSYSMARLADEAGIDVILAGDSAARVFSGLSDFLSVDIDQMIYHTRAVSRACRRACVMADLPQLTISEGIQASVSGAMALMAEGKADFVKIEGGSELAVSIANAIAEAGIPAVGHFGMPSNFVDKPGVYRKWGTAATSESSDAQILTELAQRYQSAGCCALLLAKIRPDIAGEISQTIDIPSIGIGSGSECDGQILIFEELLGLTEREPPYYVKTYAQLDERAVEALQTYIQDVRTGSFPQDTHSRQD